MSDAYSRLMGIISAESEAATDAKKAGCSLFKDQAQKEAHQHPGFLDRMYFQKWED